MVQTIQEAAVKTTTPTPSPLFKLEFKHQAAHTATPDQATAHQAVHTVAVAALAEAGLAEAEAMAVAATVVAVVAVDNRDFSCPGSLRAPGFFSTHQLTLIYENTHYTRSKSFSMRSYCICSVRCRCIQHHSYTVERFCSIHRHGWCFHFIR